MIEGAEIPISDTTRLYSQKTVKNQAQGNVLNEMDLEIQKLLDMEMIENSEHQEDEVISPLFLV